MIYYQKGASGLFIVFRLAGTSWPYGILPGLLSAVLGYVLGSIEDLDRVVRDKTEFIDNPYPFQLFAYLVGFIIVFRTNFAYQRYWEGIDAVQRMGAKWLDGACMAVAFDSPGDVSTPFLSSSVTGPSCRDASDLSTPASQESETPAILSHRKFFCEVLHLFSLLHALSLQHLRCDNDLDNLEAMQITTEENTRMTLFSSQAPCSSMDAMAMAHEGGAKGSLVGMILGMMRGDASGDVSKMNSLLKLSLINSVVPEERLALEKDGNGMQINTVARVTMVEGWIMRRLISRQKYDTTADMAKTSPPILSRLYQVISDGHLAFSQACKTAETPFPFPYQNLIRVFLWLFLLSVPFVINAKILHVPARFILNYITVASYFALAQVGDNLEDPFMPYDPNELPLVAIQHQYNAKLISLGVVPPERLHSSEEIEEARNLQD